MVGRARRGVGALPDHLVALLLVVGWTAPGLVSPKTVLGGFATPGWFLVLGVLGLGVALTIKVDGVDRATAEKLVQAAHQVCPYSKATRNNIEVKLNVA